ncbi:GNAT family N-acetyltransferase [Panacibacter ginsenosidivorans]|uniref:GNAT family N-acetyltransferase n=1 Tax=Panacibacter ginsenosidivorans TaxID=1813871 RepID=A0A5B8VCV6_9BACT|nr:GNAT family N-acetyltransferase [Panacibacter ginsenosidivorans]QEC69099.1 GNAT family N-acetyltransferase [Panacibacter ginsenosidivorans]
MNLSNTSLHQLPEVARCHLISFPGSFGTKLGYAFAIRSMEWFLAGENRFLFHVTDHDKVIGYCGGFQSKGIGDGSTSGMMQYAMKEAAMGMLKKPWLFFHKDVIRFYPLILKNISRKITGIKKNPVIHPVATNNTPSHIGLVVIGVHPDYRGKGCFELLMQHFEIECIKRHASKMTLSVRTSNARAIAAYKKTGWQTGIQTEVAAEMYKMLPA